MASYKEILAKKVGGVPVAYLAIGVVGVISVVAWRMKPAAETPETPEVPETATETATVYPSMPSSGTGSTDYSTPDTSVPDTTTPEVEVETNETWSKKAIAYLVSEGESALTAQKAVQAYIDGASLSYAQGQLIDKVISKLGTPPDLGSVGTVGKKPAGKQGTPPTVHTVQGKSDNTYTLLIKLYYGRSDNDSIDLIQAANTKLGHAGPFPVGTKVNIPAWHTPKHVTMAKGTSLAAAAKKAGITTAQIKELNDDIKFPLTSKRSVRVS